ncbi:ethanolamine utilization protein EutN [Romboutsia maritimum]|uniref:Ethanolamine utilization protein EutN n=1 Tax=Romboutsia maritimum TaxID=2020948 RepID=A0A371ISM5_9FIRM|nr:EutN/CcmL family microcompartment protein [Romboutsia maritimum]RDY23490.1 ethanolamine utilization protein EutN [Romboutsia maritimum]
MRIGKVVGNVWATRKDEKLNGQKFLVIKLFLDKENYQEGLFVASDNAGAGIGDTVLVTNGSAARASVENTQIPVDSTIVGIVDSFEVEDE